MFSRAIVLTSAISCVSAKTALLVIDVQNCFLEGGSLSVPANHVIPKINSMMADKACLFDEVVYSQDFHPANHISFGSTHGLPAFSHLGGKGSLPLMCVRPESNLTKDAACCPKVYVDPSSVNCAQQLCPPEGWNYETNNSGIVNGNKACTDCRTNPDSCYETVQEMWTDHCLQDGDSDFPSNLTMGTNPKIVQKGINQFVDAYSGFKDNSKSVETELHDELMRNGITSLYVVGIATDVCVKESVKDAIDYGYSVTLVKDATEAVMGNQEWYDAAVEYMREQGATISTVADVMATECPGDADGALRSSPIVALFLAAAYFMWGW